MAAEVGALGLSEYIVVGLPQGIPRQTQQLIMDIEKFGVEPELVAEFDSSTTHEYAGNWLAATSIKESIVDELAGKIKSRKMRVAKVAAAATTVFGSMAAFDTVSSQEASASCTWVLRDPVLNLWECVEDNPPPPPPPQPTPAPTAAPTNSPVVTTPLATTPKAAPPSVKPSNTVPQTTENPDPDGDSWLASSADPNTVDYLEYSSGNTDNGAPIDGVQVARDLGINVEPSTPEGARNAQIARSVAKQDWPTIIVNFEYYGIAVLDQTTTTSTTEASTTTTSTTEPETTSTTSSVAATSTTTKVVLNPPTTIVTGGGGDANKGGSEGGSNGLEIGLGLLAAAGVADRIAGRKVYGSIRHSYLISRIAEWSHDHGGRSRRGPGVGSKPGTHPLTGDTAMGRQKTDFAPQAHNNRSKKR